ncbi:MAG: pyroglutamyl-peptidase I [Alphaproteobacteria bacterium]|nr:pyroglutamyl-peptidase I [Alphaproteobacteria bacterium]MCW5738713.1 pyroglutamyl-peptidase I [Alphaproteobacteria bacterium]
MKRVLVTGFEPFDNDTVNPSWEAARRVDGWRCEGHDVVARRLPCVYRAIRPQLGALIDELSPDIVIALGLAGGRVDFSLERVAINVDDARIPDNADEQPIDRPSVEGGPAAYFGTLPIKAILRRVRAAGIAASVSNSAGTFVCNHTFYVARHLAETGRRKFRAGFIHVPYLPEQAARHPGAPSMSVDTLVAALRIAIETSIRIEQDELLAAGATH